MSRRVAVSYSGPFVRFVSVSSEFQNGVSGILEHIYASKMEWHFTAFEVLENNQ